MKTIIVEDETMAAKNLEAILAEVAPHLQVIAVLDSIKSTVEYFSNNEEPDLVFMDIHLADGSSFSIFKEIQISCPIIFTTAYDEYALEAFKVNSIDYLLKPIEPDHILRALAKLKKLSNIELEENAKRISEILSKKVNYNKTFLIPYQDKFIPIPVNQIAYFQIENEIVVLITLEGKKWIMDITMESIMKKLDPEQFFRANRQFIIAHQSVKEVVVWFGNRLSLKLIIPTKERIVISKARVSEFKKWFMKN